MARVLIIAIFMTTACGDRGSFTSEAPASSEMSREDSALPEQEEPAVPAPEPMPPTDPTGPPSAETLNLIKYLLAPCASPLAFDVLSRFTIGADLVEVKASGDKKTVILNGKPLWDVTPLGTTIFEFDVDVKLLGTEKTHPSYVCNSVVTSFPDDNNDKIQRHTMNLDANSSQPELTWHVREENGRSFVHKIEIFMPGAASPTILQ